MSGFASAHFGSDALERGRRIFGPGDGPSHDQEVGSGRGGQGAADGGRDVIVARGDVGDDGAQHVEGRAVTEPALQLHVELDLVEPNIDQIQPQAFQSDAYFIDMGIPEDYQRAQDEIGIE